VTEQPWAEGSGSTHGDLDGDPRIAAQNVGEPTQADSPYIRGQVFHRELSAAEVNRVHGNMLAGWYSCPKCLDRVQRKGEVCAMCKALERPRECPSCHKPLDPARDHFNLYGHCSDCRMQPWRDNGLELPDSSDRSGERLVDDLRRFIAGPCGRPR